MTTTTVSVPVFEAGRLRYRLPTLADFDALHGFLASDRARGIGGPYPHRSQAFDRLTQLVGHWHLRGFGRWLIADRETDAALGIVGLYHPSDWPEPEIAWTVFEAAEGRGIAHEAALFSRAYAYETLGWTTLISCTVPDNTRSIALARRLGATHERDIVHPQIGTLNVWRHLGPEALT